MPFACFRAAVLNGGEWIGRRGRRRMRTPPFGHQYALWSADIDGNTRYFLTSTLVYV